MLIKILCHPFKTMRRTTFFYCINYAKLSVALHLFFDTLLSIFTTQLPQSLILPAVFNHFTKSKNYETNYELKKKNSPAATFC